MEHLVDMIGGRVASLLLPPHCVLCGAAGQRPCLDLCRRCELALPPAPEAQSQHAGLLQRTVTPYAYAPPLDHLVHALKYRGELAVGRVLGTLLARRLAPLGVADAVDALVPVPLHPSRHAERGYNQSAELARWVGPLLQRPVREWLAARRRPTSPQVGLSPDERRRNVAGAFAADGASGLRLAIVDDVTTTGSTLEELARALRAAGAVEVQAWCVARAGRHGWPGDVPRDPSPADAGMG